MNNLSLNNLPLNNLSMVILGPNSKVLVILNGILSASHLLFLRTFPHLYTFSITSYLKDRCALNTLKFGNSFSLLNLIVSFPIKWVCLCSHCRLKSFYDLPCPLNNISNESKILIAIIPNLCHWVYR